ncbi:MAG: hypothetical protein ACHQT8_07010 [Chlamydiales bacterium]
MFPNFVMRSCAIQIGSVSREIVRNTHDFSLSASVFSARVERQHQEVLLLSMRVVAKVAIGEKTLPRIKEKS